MKMTQITKWTAIIAAACMIATTASAITIPLTVGLGGTYVVGTTIPGADYGNYGGQLGGDVYMANTLIGMAVNTSLTDANGVAFKRGGNTFGSMPLATGTGGVIASGGGMGVSGDYVYITLANSGYGYLVAKWDGPNGGAAVWDIAGIAAGTVLQLPNFAEPVAGVLTAEFGTGAKYGMTGWSLLNPGPSVPDAGSTALLLGAVLSGLGMMARRTK